MTSSFYIGFGCVSMGKGRFGSVDVESPGLYHNFHHKTNE